ncbi:hypothetical protein RRJ93_000491 [Vibrio parahaemolyticus]|nr:hypothetical protein [Vibrio parahaemolyticus]ELI5422546.1 hypothetical protein [Vibrio parahaemolyticus]
MGKQPARSPSRQLSLRVPEREYEELRSTAESKNISISDEAKDRLRIARNYMSTQEMLRMTEARLKRLIFNMTCSVAGLSDEEIVDAEKRFVDITRNGVKRES